MSTSTESLFHLPSIPAVPLISNDEVRRLQAKGKFYIAIPSEKIQPQCITCGGEGRFLWLDADGEAVTYECPCRDQWILYAAFTAANIPKRYQKLSWLDLGATEPEARSFVARYLDNSKTHIRSGVGLFLYGKTGTGKSSLAALALKKLISQGHDCYYTTFNDLIKDFTAGWRDNDEREWFQRRVKNATVLVIDDIGKEYSGRGDFVKPLVDEMIRHRVAAETPTIITSNLDAAEISKTYGESIYWLMREGVKAYEFSGENYREVADKRMDREAREGWVRPVVIE